MFANIMRLCAATAFVAVPATLHAAPLTVVTVAAPDINCIFNPTCKLTGIDTVGDIPLPAISGKAVLQSRTFIGAPGAPGDGLTAYEYRIDLTQASTLSEFVCVTDLAVDFGPVTKLQYDKTGPDDQVYVVTKGGLGSIGLLSADQTDSLVTFVFSQPVCVGQEGKPGDTSYFIGLASKGAPTAVTAKVVSPGPGPLDVKARAPSH
jgi:hypothetical protein